MFLVLWFARLNACVKDIYESKIQIHRNPTLISETNSGNRIKIESNWRHDVTYCVYSCHVRKVALKERQWDFALQFYRRSSSLTAVWWLGSRAARVSHSPILRVFDFFRSLSLCLFIFCSFLCFARAVAPGETAPQKAFWCVKWDKKFLGEILQQNNRDGFRVLISRPILKKRKYDCLLCAFIQCDLFTSTENSLNRAKVIQTGGQTKSSNSLCIEK